MKLSNCTNAKAFALATSANFSVGFDLIGFALEQVGDTVELKKRSDNKNYHKIYFWGTRF